MSMQLNPSEISELIKQRISEFEVVSEARNEGTIVSVSDGIIRIHGLADAMQGEMIELPGGARTWAMVVMPTISAVAISADAETESGAVPPAEGNEQACTGTPY